VITNHYFIGCSDDYGIYRVLCWNILLDPDGINAWNNNLILNDVQMVLKSKFIDKNNAIMLFRTTAGNRIAVYNCVNDGTPTEVYNIENPLAEPRRIYVLNNRIWIIQILAGLNRLWIAKDPLNPIDGIFVELPPQIFKVKILYDYMFICTDLYIQYSNDGLSWRYIYYPYNGTGMDWQDIKLFASDSKIFICGSDSGSFWADILGNEVTNAIYNTTITHNAPLGHGETLDKFELGNPVYLTGNVFKFNENTRLYETSTDNTNCISSVKSSGGVREYLGICVVKLHRGERNIGQDTIEFASHGDCYVHVSDSSLYEIGDVILMDKTILGEDVVITGIIRRMIIGKITAKINNDTVAVFMD
jgi:hypothetical protein